MIAVFGGIIGLMAIIAMLFLLKSVTGVRREQFLPANQESVVIFNFGTGMPRTFEIKLTTTDGKKIAGKYREQKFTWIFPQPPTEGPLQNHLTFQRDWINAIYKVSIFPENCDINITVE